MQPKLLLLCVSIFAAYQSVAQTSSIEKLSDAAPIILKGKITGSTFGSDSLSNLSSTDYFFVTDTILKGTAEPGVILINQVNLTDGVKVQKVHENGEYIVFLTGEGDFRKHVRCSDFEFTDCETEEYRRYFAADNSFSIIPYNEKFVEAMIIRSR